MNDYIKAVLLFIALVTFFGVPVLKASQKEHQDLGEAATGAQPPVSPKAKEDEKNNYHIVDYTRQVKDEPEVRFGTAYTFGFITLASNAPGNYILQIKRVASDPKSSIASLVNIALTKEQKLSYFNHLSQAGMIRSAWYTQDARTKKLSVLLENAHQGYRTTSTKDLMSLEPLLEK